MCIVGPHFVRTYNTLGLIRLRLNGGRQLDRYREGLEWTTTPRKRAERAAMRGGGNHPSKSGSILTSGRP